MPRLCYYIDMVKVKRLIKGQKVVFNVSGRFSQNCGIDVFGNRSGLVEEHLDKDRYVIREISSGIARIVYSVEIIEVAD